jgi:hypothetical protein
MSSDFRTVQSQNLAISSIKTRMDEAYSPDNRRTVYDAREIRSIVSAKTFMFAIYCILSVAVLVRMTTHQPRVSTEIMVALASAIVLYPILIGPVQRAILWLIAYAVGLFRYSVFT